MQRAEPVLSVTEDTIATLIDEAVNKTPDKQKCIDMLVNYYLGNDCLPHATPAPFFNLTEVIARRFDDLAFAAGVRESLIKKLAELLTAENQLPQRYNDLPRNGYLKTFLPLYSPAQFLVFGHISKTGANCLVTANTNFHEMTADQWVAFGHALNYMGIMQINLSVNKLGLMKPEQWRGFKRFLEIARLHWVGFESNQLHSLLPDYVPPVNANGMWTEQPKHLSAKEKKESLDLVTDIYKTITTTTLDLCSWDEGDKKFMAHLGFSPAAKLRAQQR